MPPNRHSGNYGPNEPFLHDNDNMDDIHHLNIKITLRGAVNASTGRPIIVFLEAASINSAVPHILHYGGSLE